MKVPFYVSYAFYFLANLFLGIGAGYAINRHLYEMALETGESPMIHIFRTTDYRFTVWREFQHYVIPEKSLLEGGNFYFSVAVLGIIFMVIYAAGRFVYERQATANKKNRTGF